VQNGSILFLMSGRIFLGVACMGLRLHYMAIVGVLNILASIQLYRASKKEIETENNENTPK
jgi:hypothetical protein